MPNNLSDIKTGEVVSVADPTYSGRIKVRIKGLNDNIDVENLPWCTYAGSAFFSGDGRGSISIPRVGTKVRVDFKKNDINSMEWSAINRLDRDLSAELAGDYEGSHTLLYDTSSDLKIMFQPTSGLRLYFKGSYIQIEPNNNITIHYGEGNQGVQIQLSSGKIDIQGEQQINVTSPGVINVEAPTINLSDKDCIKIKGNKSGECAVNGQALYKTLMNLAMMIDQKIPASGGLATNLVTGSVGSILNQQIKYV